MPHWLHALVIAWVSNAPAHTDPCAFETPTVPETGLTAADTGVRTVFDPEDYVGTDFAKLQDALTDAGPVDGAVVMERFYEFTGQTLVIPEGVMLTGGGLRRACSPNQALTVDVIATDNCVTVPTPSAYSDVSIVYVFYGSAYNEQRGAFTIDTITGTQVCASGDLNFTASIGDTLAAVGDMLSTLSGGAVDNIVVDSVAFDGNSDCNTYTHDWRYNWTFPARGANIVRNSYFYDTMSENLTICGGAFTSNTAWNLGGSFVHKSCTASGPVDTLTGNRVDGVNLYTDAVMGHSEGAFTHSSNAGYVVSSGNKYLNGAEAVWGATGGTPTGAVRAYGDCYSHFNEMVDTTTASTLAFYNLDATREYVPEIGR